MQRKTRSSPPVVAVVGFYISTLRRMRRIVTLTNMSFLALTGRDPKAMNAASREIDARGGFFVPITERSAASANRAVDATVAFRECRIAAPPLHAYEVFNSMSDGKMRTMEWLQSHSLAQHALRRYKNVSDVHNFPVTVKPRVGLGGTRVRHVTSRALLLKMARGHDMSRFLVEETIRNTTEWGVHFAAFRGNVLALRCVAIVFGSDLFVRKKGARGVRSISWVSTCPTSLSDFVSRLVSSSAYSGFGCMGVKYMYSVPRLLEVNTRLCGMVLSNPVIAKDLLVAYRDRSLACEQPSVDCAGLRWRRAIGKCTERRRKQHRP